MFVVKVKNFSKNRYAEEVGTRNDADYLSSDVQHLNWTADISNYHNVLFQQPLWLDSNGLFLRRDQVFFSAKSDLNWVVKNSNLQLYASMTVSGVPFVEFLQKLAKAEETGQAPTKEVRAVVADPATEPEQSHASAEDTTAPVQADGSVSSDLPAKAEERGQAPTEEGRAAVADPATEPEQSHASAEDTTAPVQADGSAASDLPAKAEERGQAPTEESHAVVADPVTEPEQSQASTDAVTAPVQADGSVASDLPAKTEETGQAPTEESHAPVADHPVSEPEQSHGDLSTAEYRWVWDVKNDEDGHEYILIGEDRMPVGRDEDGRAFMYLWDTETGYMGRIYSDEPNKGVSIFDEFGNYLGNLTTLSTSETGSRVDSISGMDISMGDYVPYSIGAEQGLGQPVPNGEESLRMPPTPPPVSSPSLPASQEVYSEQSTSYSANATFADLSFIGTPPSVSVSSANTALITDTLYVKQSALHQIGRLGYGSSLASDAQGIERLWANGYTGQGIKVGIYDEGVETSHAQLSGKSLTDNAKLVDGSDNPYYAPSSSAVTNGSHGTAVAGIIAAKRDGQSTVGVAYEAQIGNYGVIVSNSSDQILNEAYGKLSLYDVTNHSYGSNFLDHLTANATPISGIESAEQTARGGLGGVHIVAAGNFQENANTSQLANSRYMVTVGALERSIRADGSDALPRWILGYSDGTRKLADSVKRSIDNNATDYSAHGSNLLVSAIGGHMLTGDASNTYAQYSQEYSVTTIDRTGTTGYFSGDTGALNGTSAAAPLVSGVAALMLQANSKLGWRDVQNILAYSSVGVGSVYGGNTKNEGSADSTDASYAWKWNESTEWNGGGLHFSEQYGYGMVNAYNAVRMAEVWTVLNEGKSLASVSSGTVLNEVKVSGALVGSANIANVARQEYSINVTGNVEIENAQLTLSLSHANMSELNVYLVSPSGTKLMVLDGTEWMRDFNANLVERLGSFSTPLTFGFQGFRGETAQGTWKLVVEDSNLATTGTGSVVSANLDVYGASINVNNTYHYTDEFFTASSTQALQTYADTTARKTLSDTNGGVDWLDGAALINNTTLNLGMGQTSTVNRNGVETSFISIATGSLIENAITGDGNDTLTGNDTANKLYGMRGNDILDGKLGADIMVGGEGNDIYYIDNTGDSVIELANGGIDEVRVNIQVQTWQPSNTIYSLGANIENATALTPSEPPPIIVTPAGSTTVAGSLYGNDLNNVLHGATNISNYLYGGDGNDTIVGGNYQDMLGGDAGDDYLDGGAGSDNVVYYCAESAVTVDLSIIGSQNTNGAGWDTLVNIENILGSCYSDFLTGNEANNRFQSLGGNDTINGGGGIDLLEFTNALAAVNVNMNGWVINSADKWRVSSCTISNCEGVSGSIYNDVLTGTSGNDYLNGYAGNDTLNGGAGDDILVGGSSADVLTGGDGKDTFMLATDRGLSINGSIDTITDFSLVDDKFCLVSATFQAFIGTLGSLSASNFFSGAGQTTAKDVDDYIIYNQTTGNVFYDADGFGTASASVLIADITDGLNLTYNHFIVSNSVFA
jgi:Ca2+-binding RTX toxin-like protein